MDEQDYGINHNLDRVYNSHTQPVMEMESCHEEQPRLPSIHQINQPMLYISEDDLPFIFTQKWQCLQVLRLTGNEISNNGLKIVLNHCTPQLRQLMINDTKINWLGIRNMVEFDLLKLVKLQISNNDLGSRGMKYLQRVGMPNLRELQVQQCAIGNEGIKNISKCNWPALKQIYLFNNMLSPEGYVHLTCCQWPKLQQLQINYNKVASITGLGFVSLETHLKDRNKIRVEWGNGGIRVYQKVNQVMISRFDRTQI